MAEETQRRRHRGLLKQYYAVSEEQNNEDGFDPYNINAVEFNADLYLNKLLKECNLTSLMDKEQHIFRQIQSLDSEMQTLVYENYNKFISATDTIRKMKNDFKKMEEEMDLLATNMSAITEFSGKISGTLQGRRQQISKLSGVHTLLKKLQFLFELPPTLKTCIENEAYSQAVRHYLKAQKVLHQYQHMPSFHGIQEDCNTIMSELKVILRENFKSKDATPKQLAECVELLLQLHEPTEVLCEEFLKHSQQKLDFDLLEMDKQIKLLSGELALKSEEQERPSDAYTKSPMDVLEFIDTSCNSFLSNLCLVVATYSDLFLNRLPNQDERANDLGLPLKKLESFAVDLMKEYFKYIQKRISLETETDDNAILVRALDRFYRRVQAMNKLLPGIDFSTKATEIISAAGMDRCQYYLQNLKQHLANCLINIRQSLALPRTFGQEGTNALVDLLSTLETSVADYTKSVLMSLQSFIQNDITFATKILFKEIFCHDYVREGVIVAFLRHINSVALEFCSSSSEKNAAPPPQLILLLSRFCMNLEQSSICYLVSLTDEQFAIEDQEGLTSVSDICAETKETAQKLLDHFVKVQGLNISQMLRKSVETRDWLNAIEPRTVRAVMKRVVEDVTAIDSQVGQLYEEGVRRERSSDSSRRTYPSTGRTHRSKWNAYAPSTIDNSLMSNIQKIFSERIEIFSTVEFSKVSVMTGIIKISLKTFLECVRLRTFSRYGLQQVQVDTHYLQLYLWHFVADENLVHVLLDEIMSSAINRCLDPVLMEISVVEVICERG